MRMCRASSVSLLFLFALAAATVSASDELEVVEAAKRRDRAMVRNLIATGGDVNEPQADGATALHWAVYEADHEMAEALLDAGADASAMTDLGVTPLGLACENRDAEMVGRLLGRGADPNRTHRTRPPALMLCARTGSTAAVARLIAHGADVNAVEPSRRQTALMWAAAQGRSSVVRVLLEHGAAVDARSQVRSRFVNIGDPNEQLDIVIGTVDEGGSTPLMFAARHGDVDVARALVSAGADLNDATADGVSALVTAVHSGHTDLARYLLDAGADPNDARAGYSSLHAAVLRGDLDMVQALVAKGGVVDARVTRGTPVVRGGAGFVLPHTLTGATPFALAAKFLERGILEELVDVGADRQLPLADGTTPLMLACGVLSRPGLFDRRDRIAVVRAPDENGALAVVGRLIALGARVDLANQRGDTALHGAAAHDYTSVARLLVEHGARLDARNSQGQTPLDVVGTLETAEFLSGLSR